MTVREIAVLVGQMDPEAKHYETASDGANYTTWKEYEYIGQPADDEYGDGWKFQIDRFTREEFDPIADTIKTTLKQTPGVAFSYLVDYEQDSGYIHHIFDCEAP